MHRPRHRKIDIVDVFRLGSVLALVLMVTAFFAGCETTRNERADSNSMIQKTESGHEVHGEVGAMYGASASTALKRKARTEATTGTAKHNVIFPLLTFVSLVRGFISPRI
jgi:hypothetical protein